MAARRPSHVVMAGARRETQTTANDADVEAFLAAVDHPVRRRDAFALRDLFERVTGRRAVMWGGTIVGFGQHSYQYSSGHAGQVAAVGFSPRRAASAIYLMDGVDTHAADLDAVDLEVLAAILRRSFAALEDSVFREQDGAKAPS